MILSRRGARARESGSAFILVLVALVVLSIIGVALISLTQTELQIGSNERTSARLFYVADAGAQLAVARKNVLQAISSKTFVFPNTRVALVTGETRDQVFVDNMVVTLIAPCNLCEINQGQAQKRTVFGHASVARRVGVQADGKTTTTIGQHIIVGELDMQPGNVEADKILAQPGVGACFGSGKCN